MSAINTNLQAQSVRANLGKSEDMITRASIRLSSGEQITRAADGPAQLSIGIGLQTNVDTLKTALSAASQARSVLAVADGAYKEVGNNLLLQKALTVQANVGSLSAVELGFLDLEFQQLTQEINRLTSSTNFNGLNLIDGSLSGVSGQQTDTTSTTAASSVSITMGGTAAVVTGGFLTIAGVAFDFDVTANESVVGANIVVDDSLTAAAKAQKIADIINNATPTLNGVVTVNPQAGMTQSNRDKLSDLTATVNGAIVTVTNKRAGGPAVLVSVASSANATDHVTTISGGDTVTTIAASTAATVSGSFPSGSTTGSLGEISGSVFGNIGNPIIQPLTQTKATSGFVTIPSGSLVNGNTVIVSGRTFTISNDVTNSTTQIKRSISSDLQTLENIATFLNNSEDPDVANYTYQVQLSAGNNQISMTAKAATTALNGAGMQIGATPVTLASGVANGLDISRVTDNPNFTGNVSNFVANVAGSNSVYLNVQVGNYVYGGLIANTAPTANTPIRLKSHDLTGKGGSFDIVLAANQGMSVATQTDANTFASKISAAIGQLTFYQTRNFSDFNPVNNELVGTTMSLTAKNFNTSVATSAIASYNAATQQSSLSITLSDGRVFTNLTNFGEGVTQGQLVTLANVADNNETFNILWGGTIDFSNANSLALLNGALASSFQSNQTGMNFQVGLKSTQVIPVQLGSATTAVLFGGQTLSVATLAGAVAAGTQVDSAINMLKSNRANVGALQSRFDSAASNIETSIQNTDAARSLFQDADIPTESTNFALAQVLYQAGISVLAQVNTLTQNLLKLIG